MAILSSGPVKMTSLLEKTVAIIAPHRCILCGNYNNIVCFSCVKTLPRIVEPLCIFCGEHTPEWQPCGGCAPKTAVDRAWVSAHYDGAMAELIHRFKFDHARDAYKPLALAITAPLPDLTGFTVVPVPTIAPHIRQRSYDHTLLIAQEVARLKKLPFARSLERTKNTQQIGRTRTERQGIAESIAVRHTSKVKILLIDDVCTTGATLQACAQALKQAGAQQVVAAVAAWQPPSGKKKDR